MTLSPLLSLFRSIVARNQPLVKPLPFLLASLPSFHPALFAVLPALCPVFMLFAGHPALQPSVPCRAPTLQPGSLRRAPPAPSVPCRAPPCTPAPPFEKGGDPKTLSADGQHTFYGRAKNPERRSRRFSGTNLWILVAVPSVGVLCSRAWWEASPKT